MKVQCPHCKEIFAFLGIIIALWLIWLIVNFQRQQRQITASKPIPISIFDDDFEEKAGYMFPPGRVGVFLYDDGFEEDYNAARPNNSVVCKLIWHAYVINSFRYPVEINCFVELKDVYDGSIIKCLGPIPRTVSPSKVFPEDITGIYWIPHDVFKRLDLTNSRVYIQKNKF